MSSGFEQSHFFRKSSLQRSAVPAAAASGGYGMGKTPGKSISGWCLYSFYQQKRTPWTFVVFLVMLSQLLGVEGSTGIESSSWPCPGHPNNPPLALRALSKCPWAVPIPWEAWAEQDFPLPCCCPQCPQDRGVSPGSRTPRSLPTAVPQPVLDALCRRLQIPSPGFPGSSRWVVLM